MKGVNAVCFILATVRASFSDPDNEYSHEKVVTIRTTPNIALIKYWGKRDGILMLPYHSSISITLDGDAEVLFGEGTRLFTTTSVIISNRLTTDVIIINGVNVSLDDQNEHERFKVINILRDIANVNQKVMVVSENSFPTAAGLASSASGIAALVIAVSKAFKLELSDRQLSIIARLGSGSACRSVLGGIVRWNSGIQDDGFDSFAHQLYPASYWPELVDLIAIVSVSEKKTSSRAGMAATVDSSALYKERLRGINTRLEDLEEALRGRDFSKLASIVMKESNNMHATILDTSPPIIYLDDTSREIIYAIEDLNRANGRVIAGYTFDAGPNAHIITLREHSTVVSGRLSNIVGIKSLIKAGIGEGPRALDRGESLIDPERLNPKKPGSSGRSIR